jgi:hypothetical protein
MKLIDELVDAYLFNSFELKHVLNVKTGEILIDGDEGITGEPKIDWDDEEATEHLLPIPSMESNEGYELMDQFARNVESEKDADKLFDALNRRKPFRNFKDACIELGLIDEWHQFESE